MELTILHLYPDCMSLYGEYANLAVLRRHLRAAGVSVTVETALFEDAPPFERADLIYMGAGTERAQKGAITALLPHQSVTDESGEAWPCLGLAEFTTVETDRRDPGDVIAHTSLWDSPVVGFMNKCSVTRGVETPLFDRLSLGLGNQVEHGPEGYASGNVLGTHITGPVLVKNPDFTGFLIRRLFEAKGWAAPEALPDLPYEREAYEVTLKELSARAGG